MSIIQHQELYSLLHQGVSEANKRGTSVLVSQVLPVDVVDPLSFYAAGSSLYENDRTFWADPENDTTIVGLGTLKAFEAKEDRFQAIEQKWKKFLESSLVEGAPSRPGVGPVLLGGFSFDPGAPQTDNWSGFPQGGMVIPKLMLTKAGEDSWLTMNVVVEESDKPEDLSDKLLDHYHHIHDMMPTEKGTKVSHFSVEEIQPEHWKNTVRSAAANIREGKLEKVVLAREIKLRSEQPFSSSRTLMNLKEQQSDSYLFAFNYNNKCFIGASPERLVKRDGQQVYSTCLAGSIERGKNQQEDQELGSKLLNDNKNRIEHDLVVRMIRTAMEEECEFVQVPSTPELYKTPHIQHLYTPVVARARKGTSLLRMLERLHPTPALGGYPQHQAVKEIRQVERMDRGWYAGPVGWIDYQDNGEFAVAIRSGLLKGKHASLFAGCGIVGDSNPDSEYEETKMKFKPMLAALGGNRYD
ncbi:isochorismate synthase [Guptibacillus algicola]|uniref:isochorismate synthase n=1 Tax=Guptibacillus algicola TaxID=225844 RepID=UPI001CD7FD22|nr:isochorismate synthase [Alkalihalobacillus algicola]MCA0986455.1 isochorismate synthase [Alkalihalobacillus algicola]